MWTKKTQIINQTLFRYVKGFSTAKAATEGPRENTKTQVTWCVDERCYIEKTQSTTQINLFQLTAAQVLMNFGKL